MATGVILDADSLGKDIDLTPVTSLLDDWQVYPSTKLEDIASRISNAEVILTNKIPLTRDILQSTESLRYISVMATGTNNIDIPAATERGISVSNAVAYATPSVVQHTLSLILSLSTSLPAYLRDVEDGRWQESDVFCLLHHPIQEVAGKTLGIIGYGELGSHLAKAATALDMKVLVSERPGEPANSVEGGNATDRVPFKTLLAEADYLSLHCPLTADNHHLINQETLAQMKPGAFLINTARGGLVDSAALINALKNGSLAGAAIDVLDSEPASSSEPLINAHPRLLVTPHNAWGAIESRTRLIDQMKENIEGYLAGNPPRLVTA